MHHRTSRLLLATSILGLLPAMAAAEGLADLRKLFDAGRYQQVIDAAQETKAEGDDGVRITFLAAQSAQKLSRQDDARRAYEQLAARPESDPWHHIGQSAVALLSSDIDEAIKAGNKAAAEGESVPEAHFQAGQAVSRRQDFAGAAAHFDKAADLDPSWAYAHYYAGLAYSKIKRIDLMATHFQTFLKLAPQAPERPEVQSIMKTLGR